MSKNTEDKIIAQALSILEGRLTKPDTYLGCPDDTKAFLALKLAQLEHEVFAVIFLNARHGIITYGELFRGTISGASVYPREVVKESLAVNASAVIFAHNHPSGNPQPSAADKQLTTRLVAALDLVGIRVLDHIVVGGTDTYSFAEWGLL